MIASLDRKPAKPMVVSGMPHAGNGKGADHHGPIGQRDLLAQAAIVPHVLFMVHGMDDRAGAQEQHGLEEGVRQQVEHRRRIDADARGHEHVAQAANRSNRR